MIRKMFVAAMALAIVAVPVSSRAYVLAPGTSYTFANTAADVFGSPVGTQEGLDMASTFANGIWTGTVTSKVFRDNSTGFLDFWYRVALDPTAFSGLGRLTVTDYSGFTADVFDSPGGTSPPAWTSINRDSGAGEGIAANWDPKSPVGASTDWVAGPMPYHTLSALPAL